MHSPPTRRSTGLLAVLAAASAAAVWAMPVLAYGLVPLWVAVVALGWRKRDTPATTAGSLGRPGLDERAERLARLALGSEPPERPAPGRGLADPNTAVDAARAGDAGGRSTVLAQEARQASQGSAEQRAQIDKGVECAAEAIRSLDDLFSAHDRRQQALAVQVHTAISDAVAQLGDGPDAAIRRVGLTAENQQRIRREIDSALVSPHPEDRAKEIPSHVVDHVQAQTAVAQDASAGAGTLADPTPAPEEIRAAVAADTGPGVDAGETVHA